MPDKFNFGTIGPDFKDRSRLADRGYLTSMSVKRIPISIRKDLHCQSPTSRVFDDKGLFQKVSNQKEAEIATPSPRRIPATLVDPEQAPGVTVRDLDFASYFVLF